MARAPRFGRRQGPPKHAAHWLSCEEEARDMLPHTCDIPRLAGPIDAARFLSEYAERGQPVILSREAARRNVRAAAHGPRVLPAFRKTNFLNTFGGKKVVWQTREPRGVAEFAGQFIFGNGTLREYIETYMGHCRQ